MKTRMEIRQSVANGINESTPALFEKAEMPAVFLSRSWVRSEIHEALLKGNQVVLTFDA